ncbi:VWA domain-containing protein [Roseospira marina]|uniref:VWA domain-containing protein n=1 Tax=Roseospira marina TaxID=140057 RepID=A0A5M6I731_9PROT|nr:vWA domain-containing protein [Roseospira marina]KAA5603912.1 VWA domain-containing protein [Roseospira marina]MBB4315972.1 hypothetical protein [Roseospira marina]
MGFSAPRRGRGWGPRWNLGLHLAVLALALAGAFGLAGPADARDPMLIEGKRTLFQRVLMRPGAELRAQPNLAEAGTTVEPFSVYYVFDRRNIGGQEWVEVGADREGTRTAFVPTPATIDWKHSMILAFTNPAPRSGPDGPRPAMILDTKESLVDLLNDEAMVPKSEAWRREAIQARANDTTVPDTNPIVALEPPEYVDLQENFYLLPVLDYEDTLFRSLRRKVLLMQVASVTKKDPPATNAPITPAGPFRVGIVFVIDASASMNPYIERTRQTIRAVFQRMQSADIKAEVSFGMVAFRDNINAVPGLEYTTRIVAPLELETNPTQFLRRIQTLNEAPVSSQGFMEDALGGIDAAHNMPAWRDFNARYLVLITDASTRALGDPLASVNILPEHLNQQAQEEGFAILTLHLKTAAGVNDHAVAEQQYRALSRFQDRVLYYPIENGDVTTFGRTVDTVTADLLDMARTAIDDSLPPAATPEQEALRQVGRAMRLAYLGRQRGTRVPDVTQGWLAHLDPQDLRQAVVEPRVLLTRNQLNDLKTTIDRLTTLARTNRLRPAEFFGRLQSVAGNMVRDPERIAQGQIESLGDVVGEYLDDLPYESEIMGLTERDFLSMGPVGQLNLLRNLESKLELYRRFDGNADLWVALAPDEPEGEKVYPVPLTALP